MSDKSGDDDLPRCSVCDGVLPPTGPCEWCGTERSER